jgi:RNase P subunit RPR2
MADLLVSCPACHTLGVGGHFEIACFGNHSHSLAFICHTCGHCTLLPTGAAPDDYITFTEITNSFAQENGNDHQI